MKLSTEKFPASEDECGVRGGVVEGPVEGCRLEIGALVSGGRLELEILSVADSSLMSVDGGVEIEERNLDFCVIFCGTVPGIISSLRLTRVSCPSSRTLPEVCLFSSMTKLSLSIN